MQGKRIGYIRRFVREKRPPRRMNTALYTGMTRLETGVVIGVITLVASIIIAPGVLAQNDKARREASAAQGRRAIQIAHPAASRPGGNGWVRQGQTRGANEPLLELPAPYAAAGANAALCLPDRRDWGANEPLPELPALDAAAGANAALCLPDRRDLVGMSIGAVAFDVSVGYHEVP